MISPTVPVTQSSTTATPVASVAALPISASVPPQVSEVSGRGAAASVRINERQGTSFKAPVARVIVQVQTREEETLEEAEDVVPNIDEDQQM